MLLPVAAALAVLAGARTAYARRRERAFAARRPAGDDGVIPGARTIDLESLDPDAPAALLLHGFGDTPQTLAALAEHLHRLGWSVRAPLLPGHGRSLPAFAASRADGWVDFARDEWLRFRERHPRAALVGLSMGGAIATVLAAESSSPPTALALVAPYVSMPTTVRRAALAHWLLGAALPYVSGGGERSVHDDAARDASLAYGACTPRLLAELASIVARARRALPAVRVPTLVVQSRHDNRIPPDAAARAFEMLGAPVKELAWTDIGGHVITVDVGRERVFALVEDWLVAHGGAAAERPRRAVRSGARL
ncbi:MAG TPA: alpha/beta fold hydrolase [Gemmatimonadaceae bacterium]|nr:alpha/beta fold hydrolase [Gemmatimonadaceae bacterium]